MNLPHWGTERFQGPGAIGTSIYDVRSTPVGVLKLDVEMHELEALRGADGLLSRKLIRDIVFEEHRAAPTPVTTLLESYGYEIIGIRQGLGGPVTRT